MTEVKPVARLNRQHPEPTTERDAAPVNYVPSGHPSVEQLMAEQGTGAITDISALHGDFWPEEESIEAFLETLHEWRGHNHTEPAK